MMLPMTIRGRRVWLDAGQVAMIELKDEEVWITLRAGRVLRWPFSTPAEAEAGALRLVEAAAHPTETISVRP